MVTFTSSNGDLYQQQWCPLPAAMVAFTSSNGGLYQQQW
jgi:hypothetical protein